MADTERRRRRLRHPTGQQSREQAGTPATSTATPAPPRRSPDDRDDDRGLRNLVGSGASQVSWAAAMRARDASRPTDQDMAEAEHRLVLVRRNWVPREDLPRTGR